MNIENLKAFWLAFLISGVLSLPIMKLLVAMRSRQTVSQHAPEAHQLKQGTPTMGGIIILAGVLIAMPFTKWRTDMTPMFLLIVLFALIGFVDDFVVPRLMPGKRGLGWKQKILMQFVAAIVPLYLSGHTALLPLAYGTFVILFFANAYNFSDGLDGLAGTLLLGLLLGMVGICELRSPWYSYEGQLIFIFFGATLPFLYWNAPKAKVFMGDVGSLPIGAFLGGFWFLMGHKETIQAVASTPPNEAAFYAGLGIWSLMMVAELVPVPLQIASVKILKKKLFPYTPIHHAFEKAGWPETRVVYVFAILQVIFTMLAITVMALMTPPFSSV